MDLSFSIVTMDPINLERDIRDADELGADYFHFDLMDGHAVPRLGIYPEIVRRSADITATRFDLHLMVENPLDVLNELKGIQNLDMVSFHACLDISNAQRVCDAIRLLGCKAVVALNLATPKCLVERLAATESIDGFNFMAIHPGIVGQPRQIKNLIKTAPGFIELLPEGANKIIQCDGGATFETIKDLAETGFNNLVLGTGSIYAGRSYRNYDADQALIKKNWVQLQKVLGE